MTDYEAIGGQEAVEQLVDRLYELVYADHQLRPYFAGVDPVRLKRHKARLLTYLLGGPADYDGRALRTAHQGLGISHEHHLRLNAYLVGALWESGATVDVLLRVSLLLDMVGRRIVDGAAATGIRPHRTATVPSPVPPSRALRTTATRSCHRVSSPWGEHELGALAAQYGVSVEGVLLIPRSTSTTSEPLSGVIGPESGFGLSCRWRRWVV